MTTRPGSATVTTPTDREIVIARSFEAPATLVWEALTTPELLLRWWGPSWAPLTACEIDLRVGGAWRYVCRGEDGTEMGWHGTYREIEPTARIVSTEVFEGFPDAESLNTMTLTEVDGVTLLRTVVLHSTREARDGHLASGMERGMQETFDRLDALLASGMESGVEDHHDQLDDQLCARDAPAEQFRRFAGILADRIRAVPPDAWSRPSPCTDWTARDVVGHMVSWMPAFLASIGCPLDPGPTVDVDPGAAWDHVAARIQAVLDDPERATREFTHPHLGTDTVEHAVAMIMVGDLVIHTWDLSRATGLDESLPADAVHRLLESMQTMDDALRVGGQFGPKVTVAPDADEQTRLIAFTGRTP